jgi:hypothetical protein
MLALGHECVGGMEVKLEHCMEMSIWLIAPDAFAHAERVSNSSWEEPTASLYVVRRGINTVYTIQASNLCPVHVFT